jgi:hypothetical protein
MIKNIFHTLLFLIILFISTPATTKEVEIKASINKKIITVGEEITYRVKYAADKNQKINISLPEKKIVFPEKKEIKSTDKNKDEEENKAYEAVPLYIINEAYQEDNSDKDTIYKSIILKITFYRSGRYYLPEIKIIGADKIPLGYKIPEIEIKELNKEGKLSEIEPPLDLSGNYYRIILLVIGIIIATILSIFLVKYIYKKISEKQEKIIVLSAIEIFEREINKLKGITLINNNKIEKYIIGVSTIFRKFLSNLIKIDTAEMTSDEVNTILKKKMNRIIYKKHINSIMKSFNLWDLSKFAEFTPSEEILLENLNDTKKLAKDLTKDIEDAS